jgi:hypothetical protein
MSRPVRRDQYKNLGDAKQRTRRRKEEAHAISKSKREQLLRTKRFRYSQADAVSLDNQQKDPSGNAPEPIEENDVDESALRADIEALLGQIRQHQGRRQQDQPSASAAESQELDDLRKLRGILSTFDAPLEVAVGCGCVQVLIPYLHGGVTPELTLEAAWMCSNIATSTDKQTVEQLLQVTHLLLLHVEASVNDSVAEQCCACIGNIAAESEHIRATLLKQNAMQSLYKMFLKGRGGDPLGVTAAWAISNLVRGSYLEALNTLMSFPEIEQTLVQAFSSENPALVIEVSWILTYLSAGPSELLMRVVQHNLVQMLVLKLETGVSQTSTLEDAMTLLVPIMRALGNICCEGSEITRLQIVNNPHTPQALKTICMCLQSSRRLLQKDATFLLSNITALKGPEGVQLVKNTPNLMPTLYSLFTSAIFDIKKEIAYTLANVCAGGGGLSGNAAEFQQAAAQGSFRSFLDLIETRDLEAVHLGLQFLEMAMRVAPECASVIEELNGMEIIENVQYTSQNQEISRMASYLVDKYFAETDHEI